jgi:hypothetical protein
MVKPKIPYSCYITRVIHDDVHSRISNGYFNKVAFYIPYEPCCVGSMVMLTTTNIVVQDWKDKGVMINGFTKNGV